VRSIVALLEPEVPRAMMEGTIPQMEAGRFALELLAERIAGG